MDFLKIENADNRPKKNGFAPGYYSCTCQCCGERFMGDKRSIECADCAYDKNLQVARMLDRLLYCCGGLTEDYNNQNFGDAQSWLGDIACAYSEYQEAKDEVGSRYE